MPERSAGDMAHIRVISEQAADIALTKHMAAHPSPKAEVPAPLKIAAGILTALFTMGISAFCFWMVTTLNEMQITVARIDERQQSSTGDTTGRFQEIDRRISTLEAYHREGGDK